MQEHLERQEEVLIMAKSEKKVIAFIVEGLSDEAALGTIMKEYFSSNEVQFIVVRGDITVQDYVTVDNIKSKINDQVEALKKKYGYKTEDFIRIIHLTDMDGVYVDDNLVVEAEVESIQYYETHMESANPQTTIARNHKKADILFKLRKSGKINTIPYRIYFNSCNLEHVLYGELKDFTDEEKTIMSDDFAEQYENDVKGFIELISSEEIKAPGTYQKTWDFIEKKNRSLQRHSNMHLLFE